MKKVSLFTLGAIFLFSIIVFVRTHSPQIPQNIVYSHKVMLDGSELSVGIADTAEERRIGLSGQSALFDGNGLLFQFDKPDKYGIWMKDMKFPIDVIWFNESSQIIFIKENFSPSSYPEVVTPPENAIQVLELPAGYVSGHEIHLGQSLTFEN